MIRGVLSLDQLQRMDADEAAALLLVRQDAGDDGHDEAVFDAWLAADPAHAEAWTRACSVWSCFDAADASAELSELRQAAGIAPPAPVQHNSRRPARWGFAMAASVAIIAATGGAFLLGRQGGVGPAGSGEAQVAGVEAGGLQFATAKGEHRRFELADTSVVTLNTDSAIRVAFAPGGERRIDLLRGQAFFKVAHDKSRPFVVAVDGREVTALGTAFEVRAARSAVRVILVEGRVSVSGAAAAPVIMRAGQQLLASASGAITVSSADVAAVDDWQRGIVTFKNTTLAAAATELNRYSAAQLSVDDPRIASLTVSGVFKTNDARRFARTIEQIYPVQVVANGRKDLRIVSADPVNR